MRVYVAGSFSNRERVRDIGKSIRDYGYEAYVFCDLTEYTFVMGMKFREKYDLEMVTPMVINTAPELYNIGLKNLDELTKCDALVLVLPCGRSAHLEAGYMVGRGRPIYLIGPMERGEFDAMYVMFDGIYADNQLNDLMLRLSRDEMLRRAL